MPPRPQRVDAELAMAAVELLGHHVPMFGEFIAGREFNQEEKLTASVPTELMRETTAACLAAARFLRMAFEVQAKDSPRA